MLLAPRAPDWQTDGRDWPNRDASRTVRADGLEWHVQVAGEGPGLLLIHGAGGASHSWRGLLPALARRFRVVAPDLPGHGFTGTPADPGLTLPAVARRLAALTEAVETPPRLIVGHSAGAAIAARMALDGRAAPAGIVAINGAFEPFRGLPGLLFPALARMLHWNPFAARMIAIAAIDPNAVPAMLRGMGSRIDREGAALYARLFRRPAHVAGTVGMMAEWDLEALVGDLPRLDVPMLLLAGSADRAVPPSEAARIAALMTGRARAETLPGLGHLAHEEAPERVAAAISAFADELSLPA